MEKEAATLEMEFERLVSCSLCTVLLISSQDLLHFQDFPRIQYLTKLFLISIDPYHKSLCGIKFHSLFVLLSYRKSHSAGMSNSMYLEGHMSHVCFTMRAACAHYHERCTQNIIKTITSIIKYCYRNVGHIIAMLCSIHKHKIMKCFYRNKMKYFFKHFVLMFGISFC